MGVDFSTLVYSPNYDFWARDIYVTPSTSQPGVGQFKARGIYNHNRLNVVLEDGSMFVEQETILDVRAAEFAIAPQQGDLIFIPDDGTNTAMKSPGTFSVISAWENGGGEVSLHLRKIS